MKKIWVSIAENNDNGQISGRATMIQFDDIVMLESDRIFDGGEKITHIKTPDGYTRFRLHGRQYVYSETKNWAGNMMWNAYLMDTLVANSLLNDLHRSDKWSFNQIYTEIEDVFERREPLLQGDFEEAFSESLVV